MSDRATSHETDRMTPDQPPSDATVERVASLLVEYEAEGHLTREWAIRIINAVLEGQRQARP